jgi:hypothetical protein
LSEPLVRRTGRPYGFKPFHVVVGVVLACVWFGLAAFVLTHGRGEASSVDIYSELPPEFTAQLRAQGVQYQGLSSVDAATSQQVLAQARASGGGVASDSSAIVLRTSLTDTSTKQRTSYTDQAALMVVVPGAPTAGGSGSSVYVAFLDPVTFQVLTTLTYDTTAASASG